MKVCLNCKQPILDGEIYYSSEDAYGLEVHWHSYENCDHFNPYSL